MARKPMLLTRMFRALWRLIMLIHLLILIAVFVVVPLGVYYAFFYHPPVTVEQGTALVWAPTGNLVEQDDRGGVGALVGSVISEPERQSVVRDLVDALDRARHDDRIKLVFLKLDRLGAAQPGQIQDLDAAIDRFKQSGKRVVAWSTSYNQAQYELASHADTIYLDPMGYVFLPGYGVYRNYYKDALGKLGVHINVFRVGKYKSFVEPYTRNDMSPAARTANLAWMNSLWSIYTRTVTAQRKLSPAALKDYIDHFADHLQQDDGDAARMALQAGLVDKVATLDQVRKDMRARVGTDQSTGSFRQINQSDYLDATESGQAAVGGDRVALVVVEGDIIDGESVPGSAGGETVARLIAAARRDNRVKAVLLRVDSPGGSITASERIRREVVATRKAGKPVVVSMSGMAASGGYWISMNANQIWAEPSTITGSIGVFGIIPTFSGTLNKLGIHSDGVGTTPLSGALRLDRPLSPATQSFIQAGIEHAYNLFVGKVAQARHMDESAVRQIAQGRVWSGADAARNGLVDKLGDFTQAEKAAAGLAHLSTGQYRLEVMQPPADWHGALHRLLSAHARAEWAPAWLGAVSDDGALSWLRHGLDDPRGLYARCFCQLSSGNGSTAAKLGGQRPPITE